MVPVGAVGVGELLPVLHRPHEHLVSVDGGQRQQFVDDVGELISTAGIGVRPGQLPYLIDTELPSRQRFVASGQVGAQPGGAHPLDHRGVGDPDRRLHPRTHRHVSVFPEQLAAVSGGDDRRRFRLQLADLPLHLPKSGRQLTGVERLEVDPAVRLRDTRTNSRTQYDRGVSALRRRLGDRDE